MAITSERLNQTFSEGGAQEIYQEIKAKGDFLGFAQRYAFDTDYRVARTALWGLTKAKDEELSELKVIYNELINQAMQTANSSVRRLTLNIIEKLRVGELRSGIGLGGLFALSTNIATPAPQTSSWSESSCRRRWGWTSVPSHRHPCPSTTVPAAGR